MAVDGWAQQQRRLQNLDSFRQMTDLWPEPAAPARTKPKQRSQPPEVLIEDAEWLLGNGAMAWEVAAALHRTQGSLSRFMYRHGRADLGNRLNPERKEAA